MLQSGEEKPRNIISTEEYLKKRQAIREQNIKSGTLQPKKPANALKITEILFV